jgi:hypothetical protein
MYCVCREVQTEFKYVMYKKVDHLCGLVVRVPGCRTEMYYVSCEVRTEFIYVMYKKVDRFCGLVVRVPGCRTEMYCFLWGTNWIYVCYVEESRPPLWSSGHSSWLRIQWPGFDSRRYQIFWAVVGLERGPPSLVTTIDELLERKSRGSCRKSREYGLSDPPLWPSGTLYPQNLSLTSPTSGCRSVGSVLSRI